MPQHLSAKDKECPNPSCDKAVVKVTPLLMDTPPTDVVRYSYRLGKVLIGRVLFHEDGTLCSESTFFHDKRHTPAYLRLGDSKIDPRT